MANDTKSVLREEHYDEVELADGDTALIPEDGEVMPTFGKIPGEMSVCVQQDKIKMSTSGACGVDLGGANYDIEDPSPFASLYAEISHGLEDVDDIYAEVSFETADQVRRLRDALDVLLRYRGEGDE